MTLLFCLWATLPGNPPLLLTLDEDTAIDGETFITYPADALIHNDRIYVAPGGPMVLVFALDGRFLFQIGRAGKAPGEFDHWPVSLSEADGRLAVVEMYRHTRSFFDWDGQFLAREPVVRKVRRVAGLRELSADEARRVGHAYGALERDCYLGRLVGDGDEDLHAAKRLAHTHEGGWITALRSGTLERYGPDCQRQWTVRLKVGDLIADPRPDPLTTDLARYRAGGNQQFYYLGEPLFDMDVCGDVAWLLANDENLHSKLLMDKENIHLFRVDLNTREVMRSRLTERVSRVRCAGDKLILITPELAKIEVYQY